MDERSAHSSLPLIKVNAPAALGLSSVLSPSSSSVEETELDEVGVGGAWDRYTTGEADGEESTPEAESGLASALAAPRR